MTPAVLAANQIRQDVLEQAELGDNDPQTVRPELHLNVTIAHIAHMDGVSEVFLKAPSMRAICAKSCVLCGM